MPAGPVSFSTRSSDAFSGSDESRFREFIVDARLLRTGTNVMAVEVHQSGPTSSDLSFNLELLGLAGSAPPKVSADLRGDLLELSWSAYQLGYVLEFATDLTPPIDWQPVENSAPVRDRDLQSVRLTPETHSVYFRLRRS
jgi:hypothetical protein